MWKWKLDSSFPMNPKEKKYVVENLSACPEATIKNNSFACYPTRGLLITTSASSIVQKNTFIQGAPYPAIHISADACNWFESGGVRDLLIEGNRFEDCSIPAINTNPNNNDEFSRHRGIRIRNNTFVHCTLSA